MQLGSIAFVKETLMWVMEMLLSGTKKPPGQLASLPPPQVRSLQKLPGNDAEKVKCGLLLIGVSPLMRTLPFTSRVVPGLGLLIPTLPLASTANRPPTTPGASTATGALPPSDNA